MPKKRRGPGRGYREGITLVQIIEMFPDDAAARRWFEERLWPDGPYCPRCGSFNVTEVAGHRNQTHRCRDCPGRPLFSLKTGTVMHSSKLGYQKWAIAIYLFATSLKGVASMKIHRDLGITQRHAWHLGHRLRAAWGEREQRAFGTLEVDETHLGGKRKNMNAARRREMRRRYGGGGAAAMTTVVGARDRETGRVRARVIPDATRLTLRGFVDEVATPDATLYTDEWRSYRGLRDRHEAVNHSAGEYVREMAHTNGIESFWAILKRGYQGTFHHFSEKHMDRYVTEFAQRHNRREADTLIMMGDLAGGMAGKRLRWKDLVRPDDAA